jgi:transcriptional regulator with XRE-family HTH domain
MRNTTCPKTLGRFSAELRRLRTAGGFTKQALAAKAGLSYKHYFNLENAVSRPSIEVYAALCRALGIKKIPLLD